MDLAGVGIYTGAGAAWSVVERSAQSCLWLWRRTASSRRLLESVRY
ncbi:hypothetical protein I543_2753 [Mycobacteroides abscessus 21]|uniref:Uncharacterized protein n=1 Tax=Mycobacteroides abscessus 21 TaxID=1299324 RepID=A0A829Q8N5_9MYCO|nr:hypothetical protein I543_2753 [Mycobacteroides abscessus 21]